MTTVNLNALELNEFIGRDNPKQHCKSAFPMRGAQGTKNSAAVYFELAPGDHLGQHTDSAEELLLILEGEVEVTVGDETDKAGRGSITLVPKLVPHNLKNTGATTAKVLGFFGGANNIVATFEEAWLQMDSNIVDTASLP